MQQLFATFGIDLSLIIAQAVNFGVLFLVLTYLLYKPVLKTLDERRAKVAQGVEDAEKGTAMLATADTEAGARVKAAEEEATSIVNAARDAAGSEKVRIMKEAEARAAALEADAAARATEDATRMLRESEKEIARLAVLAAEKALRKGTA